MRKNHFNSVHYNTLPNYSDIQVGIDTVHGVKGETHSATLYLETFYKGLDLNRIIPFLKGEYDKKVAAQKKGQEALKVTYVGMSRPTHLLCITMNSDGVTAIDIEGFREKDWEVIYISEPSLLSPI
ncbi:hypothetical protein [Exiguobacterium sp. s7]|uniref:hypothetical protein n=1 Tax=Exiguobacterium sp. s7 TaxID=2751235 RepID=UPI001BEAE7A5|nr:hypothetical protein [Exiguobacterium sp. s7]